MARVVLTAFAGFCLVFQLVFGGLPAKPYQQWSQEEAVAVLNKSPWARQLTFTRVVGGVGSGVFGEKEIYSTFFVRFLSARPIREALVRLRQIKNGHEQMDEKARRSYELFESRTLGPAMNKWIVLSVNFRSNDPNTERSVKQYLQNQNFETIRNRVYLSTFRFPHLQISAYYPPQGDTIGAKFVFERQVDGEPVITPEDKTVTFRLEVPSVGSGLVVDFPVSEMAMDGELVL